MNIMDYFLEYREIAKAEYFGDNSGIIFLISP